MGSSHAGLLTQVLSGFEVLVLERIRPGCVRMLGRAPEWFRNLPVKGPADISDPLAHLGLPGRFLMSVERFWEKKQPGPIHGPNWSVMDRYGDECFLSASACYLDGREFLLARCRYRRRGALWRAPASGVTTSAEDRKTAKSASASWQAGAADLVGLSSAMKRVFRQIAEIAATESTVLIRGETGTGKELVARAIHASSNRGTKPFIAVNCASMTESLLASQLFGHARGAFTDAVGDREGIFEAAHGGSVLLDEIGDSPLCVQTSLLRVLQEKEITRVGENTPRSVNVRLIVSTQSDLQELIKKGRFRPDFYYRIHVATIDLPPLRERTGDIPLLARYFVAKSPIAQTKNVSDLSEGALAILEKHSWPGNVRELRSVIETALIYCQDTVLRRKDVAPQVFADSAPREPRSEPIKLTEFALKQALMQAGGNRSEAARLLGVSRATFYRHLKSFSRGS